MDNNKIISIADKVKAFGAGLVGVCFFSIGSTYFEERLVYRLPRILIPVLDMFGNIALAIAMLVLGMAFIYYGFVIWKKASGKLWLYSTIAVVALIAGVALALSNDVRSEETSDKILHEMENNRQEQIDAVKNSGDLNFTNANVEKHIATFDNIYEQYKRAAEQNDEEGIKKGQDRYMEWAQGTALLMTELNNDQKSDLARYLAKLSIKWSEVKLP